MKKHNLNVGDRVIDINPNWPRCKQVGTVVSIQGNKIDWRSDTDYSIVTDTIYDLAKVSKNNTKGRKRYNMRVNKKYIKGL